MEQDNHDLEKTNKTLQAANSKVTELEQRNKELYAQQLKYQEDIALVKEVGCVPL